MKEEYLLNHWWLAVFVFVAVIISVSIVLRQELEFRWHFGEWPDKCGADQAVWTRLSAWVRMVNEAKAEEEKRREEKVILPQELRSKNPISCLLERRRRYKCRRDLLERCIRVARHFGFDRTVSVATRDLHA